MTKMFSPLYIYLITIIKLNEMTTLDAQLMTQGVNSIKNTNDDIQSNAITAQNANPNLLSPKASSLHQIIVPYEEGT